MKKKQKPCRRKYRPFLEHLEDRRMLAAEVHQAERVIGVLDRTAIVIELQPADSTMVELDELPVDLGTLVIGADTGNPQQFAQILFKGVPVGVEILVQVGQWARSHIVSNWFPRTISIQYTGPGILRLSPIQARQEFFRDQAASDRSR